MWSARSEARTNDIDGRRAAGTIGAPDDAAPGARRGSGARLAGVSVAACMRSRSPSRDEAAASVPPDGQPGDGGDRTGRVSAGPG